ncbi:unnamed protein product, partial [Peniophora sp. CBMAI 1063]
PFASHCALLLPVLMASPAVAQPTERARKRQRTDDGDARPSTVTTPAMTTPQRDEVKPKVEPTNHDGLVNEGSARHDTDSIDAEQEVEAPTATSLQCPRSSIWFEDGNCFVIAGQSVARIYRVPGSAIPIVTILDQPHHVEVMLEWILGERKLDRLPLGDLAACYELAAHHEIEDLCAAAVNLLRARYPNHLSTWQEAALNAPSIAVIDHLLVASITAARGDAKIASLALYEAVYTSGFSHVLKEINNLRRTPFLKPHRIDRLQQAVIAAYPQLVSFQGQTYSKLLNHDVCDECTNKTTGACAGAMRLVVSSFVRNAQELHAFSDHAYEVCDACKDVYVGQILRKRMKLLFKKLPLYFELVSPAGDSIPEPRPDLVFWTDGRPPPLVVDPPEVLDDTELEELEALPHVRALMELRRMEENTARELVAAALAWGNGAE